MKKIGLLGGMSPYSTLNYYKNINTFVNKKMGRHYSAEIIMVSVQFENIVNYLDADNWDEIANIMLDSASILQRNGADIIAICSNPLHKTYPILTDKLSVPLLHILDPTIDEILKTQVKKVVVLGTNFTMEGDFYVPYLKKHCNAKVVIPRALDRQIINRIIFDDLVKGHCTKESINKANTVVGNLISDGVDSFILGCTELPILFDAINFKGNTFNTEELHSRALARFACTNKHNAAQNQSHPSGYSAM